MMDDLQKLTSTSCTELERLAAAAATMVYSDPTCIVVDSSQNDPLPSTLNMQQSPTMPHSSHYVLTYPRDPNYASPQTYMEPNQEQQHQTNHIVLNSHDTVVQRNVLANYESSQSHQDPNTPIFYSEIQTSPHTDKGSVHSYSPLVTSNNVLQFPDASSSSAIPQNIPTPPINNESSGRRKRLKAMSSHKRQTNISTGGNDSKKPFISENCESGKNVFMCEHCNEEFSSVDAWQQHQQTHSLTSRRNVLALEVKIEIIKRINSGGKQGDIAEEYGLNRSTIKSIMKKSSSYLYCWKNGMFHPDSKRLKGAKREDVEQALFTWYQQSITLGNPVSGPILCAKALDFAGKLGHSDFKATHGWLDRFKKRKNIVFGRPSSKHRKTDSDLHNQETNLTEWQHKKFPRILEYEANDIFSVAATGLLYHSSPIDVPILKEDRCPAGVRARQRLSVVLCANMTGSEKFPLLVFGNKQKPEHLSKAKSLPVQYVSHKYSWLTEESFIAWLNDLDSWFVQQGRKVYILIASSPVHNRPISLKAINLVILPKNVTAPLQEGPIKLLKSYYRRSVLETLLSSVSRDRVSKEINTNTKVPKISLVTSLHLLANAWHGVTENSISNGFLKSGIIKYSILWDMTVPPDPFNHIAAEETLANSAEFGLQCPGVSFSEYVHFDDKVQTCHLMDDDDILASVTRVEELEEVISDEEELIEDDHHSGPSHTELEKAFSTLRQYVQYQEGAQEMFRVLAHLEYLLNKLHHTKPVNLHSFSH